MEPLTKWKSVKLGATVALSDSGSIAISKKQTGNLSPLDMTVQSIGVLHDGNGLSDWVFITLVSISEKLMLCVQVVDEESDFFLYSPSELSVKNRSENIVSENLWLFDEPDDPNNFRPLDLVYAFKFTEHPESGGEIEHLKKEMGDRTGQYSLTPPLSGLNQLVATYVPYSSKDGNQACILEIGEINNENGGAIQLFSGTQIKETEVEIYQ